MHFDDTLAILWSIRILYINVFITRYINIVTCLKFFPSDTGAVGRFHPLDTFFGDWTNKYRGLSNARQADFKFSDLSFSKRDQVKKIICDRNY